MVVKTMDAATFQESVQPWLMACFGAMIAGDREERNHRAWQRCCDLVLADLLLGFAAERIDPMQVEAAISGPQV